MSQSELNLSNPPIVEAVLDVECDLPPGRILADLEGSAREIFRDHYPKFRTQVLQEHHIEATPGVAPVVSSRHAVQALQFLTDDEKQLVQIRGQGYSFNRLAPYSSLDDYLPEIQRSWGLFVGIVKPVQIRLIRLRYINRIMLPMKGGIVQLDEYFKVAPHLPEEDRFTFIGFLNQHSAVETATGNQVNIVLTAQPPVDEKIPVIFDNTVVAPRPGEPEDWPWILATINELRDLKNLIFREALTESCLDLFQRQ